MLNHSQDAQLSGISILEKDRTPTLDEKISPSSTVEDPEKNKSIPDFPDGGLRAWLTVFGVWMVQFSTFGYINAFGVYQDHYVRIYLNESSTSQISWIGSVQLFLVLAMGVFTGDAFDRGYYYHLMIGGTAVLAFSLFMLSLTSPHHYYQVLLSDGFGVGIGVGMTYIPSMSIISHYFQRRRTLALGIAASGSSLGGILHPIMLNHLFHGTVGFRGGVRASAALILGLLTIAIFLTRPRLPTKKSRRFFSKVGAFARDPSYVVVVIGACFVMLGLYFPPVFFQLDAIKHNVDVNFAFFAMSTMNGANLLGRIVPNIVAHRYGVFNVIVPGTVICGFIIFSMVTVQNVAGTVTFAILFGFSSGCYISLFPPLMANITNDLSEFGCRWGICISLTGVAALISLPIGGALLSRRFLWWRPAVFAGTSVILGILIIAASRLVVEARKGKVNKNSV